MKRSLLITLAVMLFGWCGTYAQLDTVWVSDRYCSTENIAVSPDERFVVTWGDGGWAGELLDGNGYGEPAKVFNAQTGEWLKTFYDSVHTDLIKNHVAYVSFSPDSSKMLVGFESYGNLIVDLNDNFNVIDTVPASGIAHYSPDMSLIVGFNKWFFDANTMEKVAEFDYKDKIKHYTSGQLSTSESVGIFRKNGREYVFTYRWGVDNLPPQLEYGTGMAVIDLVDSTITLTPDVPYAQWYYRNGCDRYAMFGNPVADNNHATVYVKDIMTDSILNPNVPAFTNVPYMPLDITPDNLYLVLNSGYFRISDGELLCEHFIYVMSNCRLGNEFIYSQYFPENRIKATRACINYLGVPPPAIQEDVQTFPVPTNNKLNMNIELKAGDYKAEVIDMQGNTIKVHNFGFKSEGNEKLEFDTSDLPSGTYMVILRSENDSKTVKFIKN